MSLAQLIPPLVYRDYDNNGNPLANGQVFTYQAGTSIPQASYTDATRATPNANPVTLNFRGEANIWLDPTLSYKVIVQDSLGNVIRSTDNINGFVFNVNLVPAVANTFTLGSGGPSGFSWANGYFGPNNVPVFDTASGGIGYWPATAGETAASLTIVSFFYPPGAVDRYGTNTTPGTTDMTVAFNAAATAAVNTGCDLTWGYTSQYLVTAPINCTFAGSANQSGFAIRNIGPKSEDAGASILARHNGVAIFDCTGCDGVRLYDVTTRTDSLLFPQCGVLFAKNTSNSGNSCRMFNCYITGFFSVAPMVDYGMDDCVFVGNKFTNQLTAAGGCCAVFCANNVFSLVSVGSIATGAQNMSDIVYYGNWHDNLGGTTTTYGLYLEGQAGFKFYGGYIFCGGTSTNAEAGIFVDGQNSATSSLVVDGVFIDVSTHEQAYGILVSNHAKTHSTWRITNCKLGNATYAIAAAGTNPIGTNFFISNIFEGGTSHGLNWPGTLENSIIDDASFVLTIGTSQNNSLRGFTDRWNVTTRANDNWIEMGTANRTWTPILNSFTGSPVTTSESFEYNGSKAFFTATIKGTGVTATLGSTTISGLPAAATQNACDISVFDIDAPAALGQAAIALGSSSIKIPTISSNSNHIVISGWYYVA